MPYSGANDPDLPDNVKELSEDEREQWVNVFNSAYESCLEDEGEDCEGSAIAQAWGVVKKRGSNMLKRMIESFSRLFKDRAISMGTIYQRVEMALREMEDYPYLADVYLEDGSMVGLFSKIGRLYTAPITVTQSGEVELGEMQEITIEFQPVNRTQILRDRDGRYRWLSISGSAILNRDNEIDSRDLFDQFVKQGEEGVFPVRRFFHIEHDNFIVGQTDFVARDGNLLITSGYYHDTELAKAEVKARMEDPDKWGDSIGYYPTEEPDYVEIGKGVKVPVYRNGVLAEISTLPESFAGSWLTGGRVIREGTNEQTEESTMLTERQKKALIDLVGEETAEKFLASADGIDRAVEESGVITRDQEDQTETEEQAETQNQPETQDQPETEEEAQPVNPVELPILLEDEAIEAVARQVAATMPKPMTAEEIGSILADAVEPLVQRVEDLEAALNVHRQAAEDDRPTLSLRGVVRPSVDRAVDPKKDQEEEEEEAERPDRVVLDRMPEY